MASTSRKRSKNRFPQNLVQSVMVPKSHPDVKREGIRGAIAVAARHGVHGVKPHDSKNYYKFRSIDPKSVEKDSYLSLRMPSGVLIISARLKPAIARQSVRSASKHCESGGRKRLRCGTKYVGKAIGVNVRMTEAEMDRAPQVTSIAELLKTFGKSRLQVLPSVSSGKAKMAANPLPPKAQNAARRALEEGAQVRSCNGKLLISGPISRKTRKLLEQAGYTRR